MTISYTDPAINYYVDDVEVAMRFYVEHVGFVETFRTPEHGTPVHVELRLGSFTLGLASKEAAQAMHGLSLGPGDARAPSWWSGQITWMAPMPC